MTAPAIMDAAVPTPLASPGRQAGRDQVLTATHATVVAAPPSPPSTTPYAVPNGAPSAAGSSPDRAQSKPDDQRSDGAVTQQGPAPARSAATSKHATPGPDPALALLADVLDDLERTRLANENRLRQLTRDEPDVDGEMRGFGLTDRDPSVATLIGLVAAIKKLEHDAELALGRALRKHRLGPWVKSTVGVGPKQGARLLAAIGDPYWNTLHDRPRTVSELWAYCGLHVVPAGHGTSDTHARPAGGGPDSGDPGQPMHDGHMLCVGVAARKTKGQRPNWSPTARMRAHLVAESCMKQRHSPYRAVYDDGRAKYANAVHAALCVRCGPAGAPAGAGSPLSDGHKHARALRLVAKAVLRDLWREAKRLADDDALSGAAWPAR